MEGSEEKCWVECCDLIIIIWGVYNDDVDIGKDDEGSEFIFLL